MVRLNWKVLIDWTIGIVRLHNHPFLSNGLSVLDPPMILMVISQHLIDQHRSLTNVGYFPL